MRPGAAIEAEVGPDARDANYNFYSGTQVRVHLRLCLFVCLSLPPSPPLARLSQSLSVPVISVSVSPSAPLLLPLSVYRVLRFLRSPRAQVTTGKCCGGGGLWVPCVFCGCACALLFPGPSGDVFGCLPATLLVCIRYVHLYPFENALFVALDARSSYIYIFGSS